MISKIKKLNHKQNANLINGILDNELDLIRFICGPKTTYEDFGYDYNIRKLYNILAAPSTKTFSINNLIEFPSTSSDNPLVYYYKDYIDTIQHIKIRTDKLDLWTS